MFKKSLLALTIAGTASLANAATIYVDTTEAVIGDVDAAFDIVGPAEGFGTQCFDLGVKELGGVGGPFTDGTTVDDTVSFTPARGLFVSGQHAVDSSYVATGPMTLLPAPSAGLTLSGNDTCLYVLPTKASKNALVHSVEYAQAKAIEISPSIVAGVGGYKDEDTITINITGANFDLTKTTAPTITIGDRGASVTSASVIDFTVLEVTATTVRFTVQAANPLTEFVVGGAILELGGLFIDSADLTSASSVSIASYATNTSGTKFDEAPDTVVATLVPQYTTSVTHELDAKIDVGADRQEFAGTQFDALHLKTTNNPGLSAYTGFTLVPKDAMYKITGDFSWMTAKDVDSNEDGVLTSSEIGEHVKYTGADSAKSMSVNAAMDVLTVVRNTAGAIDAAPVFTFEVPGADDLTVNPVISVQDFTVALTVNNAKTAVPTSVTMTGTTAIDAGSWTLNGSVVVVPYAPFGPNTQPIIRHTNAGTRTGDIAVRYMQEDVHTEWQSLSAANVEDAAPGVRNMLSLVTEALKGEGLDASKEGFKVALEFVTDAPSKDVFVFGGIKVTAEGQDRLNLQAFKHNHD